MVRKQIRLAFGRNSISDRFYQKMYLELFQFIFQWEKLLWWQIFLKFLVVFSLKFKYLTLYWNTRKTCEIELLFPYSNDIKILFAVIMVVKFLIFCIIFPRYFLKLLIQLPSLLTSWTSDSFTPQSLNYQLKRLKSSNVSLWK